MASTSEVIESYKVYIEVKYPSHLQSFCTRLKNSPEGAKAEAIMFSVLRANFDNVKLGEDISTGGVDFLCDIDGSEFLVEVTCLEAEAVAIQSGMKNEILENGSAGWFCTVTHMLRTKASGKAAQVSGHNIPRVLAITTEHIGGDFLLGPYGAETLLTSDTKIRVPIEEPIEKTDLSTDLKDSVFFRFKNGAIESCRRSISCILLININADKVRFVGVLHPEPKYEFSIKLFPSVPFARIKKWPPENNKIETEWVIKRPKAASFYHQEIKFRDEELKCI